jgi:hypothetical protein
VASIARTHARRRPIRRTNFTCILRSRFRLINMRADVRFAFFRGGLKLPRLAAWSNSITFEDPHRVSRRLCHATHRKCPSVSPHPQKLSAYNLFSGAERCPDQPRERQEMLVEFRFNTYFPGSRPLNCRLPASHASSSSNLTTFSYLTIPRETSQQRKTVLRLFLFPIRTLVSLFASYQKR